MRSQAEPGNENERKKSGRDRPVSPARTHGSVEGYFFFELFCGGGAWRACGAGREGAEIFCLDGGGAAGRAAGGGATGRAMGGGAAGRAAGWKEGKTGDGEGLVSMRGAGLLTGPGEGVPLFVSKRGAALEDIGAGEVDAFLVSPFGAAVTADGEDEIGAFLLSPLTAAGAGEAGAFLVSGLATGRGGFSSGAFGRPVLASTEVGFSLCSAFPARLDSAFGRLIVLG